MAILKDVAETDGPGISWRAYANAAEATLWQRKRAELDAMAGTRTWPWWLPARSDH